MADLINDYRPDDWDEIIGQSSIVRSLKNFLLAEDSVPHGFLFHGASGVGKTTVGRILASKLGCVGPDLIEVDAATHSGVEAIRKIASRQQYRSTSTQVTIIDECHALSASSWKALLKPIEEAPDSFYWIFCTTEPTKVPKNIKTRCAEYGFTSVSSKDIFGLISEVAEEEEIELDSKILDLIVQASDGSPRQALSYLSTCRGAESVKEAQTLLRQGFDHMEAIELVRMIAFNNRASFSDALAIIRKLRESVTAESVRLTIVNYCANVLLSEKGAKDPERMLAILEEFDRPFFDAEKMAPIILSVGRLML